MARREYCILLVNPHPSVTLFLILATKCQTDLKEEENEEFVRLYKKGKGEGAVAEDAYKAIPKFYFKVVIQNALLPTSCQRYKITSISSSHRFLGDGLG